MKATVSRTTFGAPFRPMIRFIELMRAPFPYYLNDDRKNTLLAAGISLFLVAFMFVFQHSYVHKIFLISGITFVILFLNIVMLPKVVPSLFDNWTVGKYIAFSFWQLLMDGFAIAVVLDLLNFHPESTLGEKILYIYPSVLSNGVIPLSIATLLLRNNMLQENLRSAVRANRELDKIKHLKEDPAHTRVNVITIYSDTKETLELPLADLLYVEASDNYSTVYWRNGQTIEKRMLRINLKNIEGQLDNYFAIRCHRSFIVNINAIDHVTGNANGYKLSIRDTNFSVPVSRAKGKEVIEKIEQLRNVFELN
ncbi:MAG TPA: LytTR family DNA-binding domain-containing protein [Ohtaekwangia sp.]|uniref:LytR/AlgR family response regulator transcription factor n=1 Tax=Ohtaekwangia sp. TaxID=2066019 RepID=UPI002F91E250